VQKQRPHRDKEAESRACRQQSSDQRGELNEAREKTAPRKSKETIAEKRKRCDLKGAGYMLDI
jgi:hypothetical protein